jgi:hypothetical protein
LSAHLLALEKIPVWPSRDDERTLHHRIVAPIFRTGPLTGRIVEPVEGWLQHIAGSDEEPDSALIAEWFTTGERLSAEHEIQHARSA